MLKWFVARTKTSCEFWAKRNIDAQGFESFLPVYRRLVVSERPRSALAEALGEHKQHTLSDGGSASSTEWRRFPLFPRYLFVRFDPCDAGWVSINSTRGVVRLIAEGSGEPIAIRDKLMGGILGRADAEGVVELDEPSPERIDFAEGAKVIVMRGPDQRNAVEAIFRRYEDDGERAVVFSRLLGGTESWVDPSVLKVA